MVRARGQMEKQEGKGWDWRRDGEGYPSAPQRLPLFLLLAPFPIS